MATELPVLGHDLNGRSTHVLDLASWGDWPADILLPSRHFCLLLAANGQDVYADKISALASSAISAGCAYLCAWGPECEFVHDVVDETYVGEGVWPPDRPHLMTTWHANESLEEAIDFLCSSTLPAEPLRPTCRAVVAAVIGNPEWSAVARKALSNIR